jgi:hypothetical protein
MKLADGDARFVDGLGTYGQRIHIFDAQYVADNIYFGDAIGPSRAGTFAASCWARRASSFGRRMTKRTMLSARRMQR